MLTPATLTVTFTANYAGPHRICWRIQGSMGPYVCTNIVNCAGGGNACQAVVTIMVDPESCDPVTYEGYIQATCNPEGSSVDQVPWVATFTPNPVCKMYALTCTDPLAQCPTIQPVDMGLNCNGTARPAVGPINPNSSVYMCAVGVIPNLPAGYTMTQQDLCCYECTQYSAAINPVCPSCILDGSSMYYVDCATRELVRIDFTGTDPVLVPPFCAVTGSVSLQLNVEASGTVTTVGPCP